MRQTPDGSWHQLAVYRDEHGAIVGIKDRDTGPDAMGKEFSWVGSSKGQLFGRHLWGSGGRMLTIVEGEIDAITVSQAQDHKWPVVSVPNGAAEAAKAIAKNLEWINSFERVNLGFDMDTQGREAAQEAADVLPPGKAFIIAWPNAKDASDLLQQDRGAEITKAIWNAKPYRPDGVLDARDLTERCMAPVVTGIPWPWPFLTGWTYGRRDGEVYTLGAGTGVGKSDWLAEVIACTISGKVRGVAETFTPEGFAVFGYEAGPANTKKQIAGKLWAKRFHIPQDDSGTSWTDAELVAAMAYMDNYCWPAGGKLFINDSFGAADWDVAMSRIRYLAKAEGIKHFAIDPISALVTGEEDERKLLDKLVLESSQLAQELRVKLYLFSHLTRPEGTPHEEGGRVQLKHLRGANGIGMFSHFVFGLERNQQAEEEADRARTTLRCLKDRYTGNSLGKTDALMYDVLTGTLDTEAPLFSGDT